MSSKSEDDKYEELLSEEFEAEEPINFTSVVIPFSMFGKMTNRSYIYYGFEKIPFKERHPLFQVILRNEFAELMS